jgi:hypothetical protein
MRTAITLAYGHGKDSATVLFGPEVRESDQREAFKKLPVGREHPDFDAVEIWASDSGIVKSRRFEKAGAADARAKLAADKLAADKLAAESSTPITKTDESQINTQKPKSKKSK